MIRSTKDLESHGTRSVRKTALNNFNSFLSEGGMNLETFDRAVRAENGARTLLRVIDAYGIYLISKKLKTNSVLSYFGNTKVYLLEKYPNLAPLCSHEINKIRKRVEKFCNKRQDSVTVKQAPPLQENDLAEVVKTLLHSSAEHEVDCYDAALLLTMWCLF